MSKRAAGAKAIPKDCPSVRLSTNSVGQSTGLGSPSGSKVLPNHAEDAMKNIEILYRQQEMCDVILKCQGHRFRGHKVVLASCAQFFEREFADTVSDERHQCQVELVLDMISPDTMASLLDSMYSGQLNIDDGNVYEMLRSAAKLKFLKVEEACGDFLIENLSPSNCLRMLSTAHKYCLRDLEDAALHVAARHFLEITEGSDFFHLDLDQLLALLERDDINTDSELDVFKKAMSWIESDKGSRLECVPWVMKRVRLPLLTPAQVVDQVESIDYLMALPECQKLVKEALYYHCLPARQSILQNQRTCPRSRSKREVVIVTGGGPRLKTEPVSQDVMYFDHISQDWHLLATMPEPRHHHAVAVLGGFMYVAGGESRNDQQSPLKTCYRYDPRRGSWLQVASMRKARESFQMGVLGGMLYAVGGRVDQSHSLAAVERYNPAVDSWEAVAPMAVPRRSIAVAAHGGRLYAMGGSGYKRISSKVERYNPLNDRWENKRPLSMPRFFAMLVSTGNKLLLFGGATLDASGDVICAKLVECYTPTTDTWVVLSPMLHPRAEAGCAILGTEIYVMGGYSWDRNERLSSAECYDITHDRWRDIARIGHEYTGLSACSLVLYNLPEKRPPNDAIDDEMYACASEELTASPTGTYTARADTKSRTETETVVTERRSRDKGRGEPRHIQSCHQ